MNLAFLLADAEVLSVSTETIAQDFPSSQFEIPGPTRERITVVLLSVALQHEDCRADSYIGRAHGDALRRIASDVYGMGLAPFGDER